MKLWIGSSPDSEQESRPVGQPDVADPCAGVSLTSSFVALHPPLNVW